ncbi:unnamed protein product [Brassica oleracea]
MLTYNILDGTIYQAPQLCSVFAPQVVCFFILSIYKAFYAAALKLETIRQVDAKNQNDLLRQSPQWYTIFHTTSLPVSISNKN